MRDELEAQYRRLAPAANRFELQYLSSLLKIRDEPEIVVRNSRKRIRGHILVIAAAAVLLVVTDLGAYPWLESALLLVAGVLLGMLRFLLFSHRNLANAVAVIDWETVRKRAEAAGLGSGSDA